MMHTIAAHLVTRAHLLHQQVRAHRDRGATATEYGLLVTLIAVVIVVGVTAFGQNLNAWFTRLAQSVNTWGPAAPGNGP